MSSERRSHGVNGGSPTPPVNGRWSWLTGPARILRSAWLNAAHPNDNLPQDYPPGTSKKFTAATDKFFSELDRFQTEQEFIQPGSEKIVQKAFNDFLQESGLVLSQLSLPILMTEKSGKHAFRDDGVTPNWYHELRQIVGFLSLMRSGKLNEKILEPFGGADVVISAILRHDSIEDHGKTKAEIQEGLRTRIETYANDIFQAGVNGGFAMTPMNFNAQHERLVRGAEQVAEIVDLMSRKEAIFKDGKPVRDEATGRVVTVDRFGGNLDTYFTRHLENPIAVLLKYFDSIEGTSTRLNVAKFLEKNDEYARKTFRLYGDRPHDEEASARWPQFAPAIHSADGMLGIDLAILRNNNEYGPEDPKVNPKEGWPIRTRRYADNALEGYCYTPRVCRPDLIALGRVEVMAHTNPRQKDILENMLYPSSGITLMREHVRMPYTRPLGPPQPATGAHPNGAVGG